MSRQTRKQYRVCFTVAWDDCGDGFVGSPRADKKVYATRKRAERRSLLYGPEPWLAFGVAEDSIWCHGKNNCANWRNPDYEETCPERHSTAREFWEERRAEMGVKFAKVWIEERTISTWQEVEP